MVTFSCEACNDTIIKKKLDQHTQRCYGAYFTCIDCSTTFQGVDYRGHTSCISEAEKYEKALYKGKKTKTQQPKESKPESKPVTEELKPELKQNQMSDFKEKADSKVKPESLLKSKKSDSEAKLESSILDKYLKSNKKENLYKIIKKASKENSKEIKEFLKTLEVSKNEEGKIVLK